MLRMLLHSDTVISLPTFIIAECVLIYLDPDSTRAIVGWASKTFSTAIFFLYEQVLSLLKTKDIYFFVYMFVTIFHWNCEVLWFLYFQMVLLCENTVVYILW